MDRGIVGDIALLIAYHRLETVEDNYDVLALNGTEKVIITNAPCPEDTSKYENGSWSWKLRYAPCSMRFAIF